MEPANGCRICMTILSGERQGSLGLVYGGLAGRNLVEPSGYTSPSYNWPTECKNHRIVTVSWCSDPQPHIRLRRRRTIASIRPEPNVRKGNSYEGENCGG